MLLDFNNISFKKIDSFIHAYHIPFLHDYLLSFKEEWIRIFEKKIIEKKKKNQLGNILINNEKIDNIFTQILYNYYLIDKTWVIDNPFGIYIQDKDSSVSAYHNHTPNTIASTMYINPPLENEGGEIQFYLHEIYQPKILPQRDYIYFFPAWLMHRPLPQTTNQKRICINWSYNSSKRPTHKLTGDRW